MCFLGYAGNVINEYNQSACLVLARCYPAMRDGSPCHQAHVDWCHPPYAVVKRSSLISIYMFIFCKLFHSHELSTENVDYPLMAICKAHSTFGLWVLLDLRC